MSNNIDDAEEFEKLFTERYSAVRHLIFNFIKSEEDANDIAQDVFTALWAAPRMWKGNPHPEGYIYNMAKYMALDFIKHKTVERNYQEQIQGEWLIKELMDADDEMVDSVYYKDICLLLRIAVEHFPEQRKKIFSLSRIKGLSNQQIADSLGISVRTVEHHIYLALTELKKIIFIFFFPYFGTFI